MEVVCIPERREVECHGNSTTTLAKKIETGTQAKHRRVHARQITRLCHVRAVVSIFWPGKYKWCRSARLYLNKVNSWQTKLHDIFRFLKDKTVKDAKVTMKRVCVCVFLFVCKSQATVR